MELKEDLSNWDEYEAALIKRKPKAPKDEPERYGVEVFKMTWATYHGGWTRSVWHWKFTIYVEDKGYNGTSTRIGAYYDGFRHLRWALK